MGIRYDYVTLDYSAQRRAADGSLIVRGRFARTGLQTYNNSDGTERTEYRASEDVQKSAPTFEGVAITDTHPSGAVDPNNWGSLAKGHVQNIAFLADGPDGESWLEGDFHVKDATLISLIDRGERPELSAGYFCTTDDTQGEYKGQRYNSAQHNIEANHVATIPPGTARAGREARLLLDSDGNQQPPGSGREQTYMDEQETKLVALTSERDQLKARADALAAEVDALKAKLAEATDPSRVDAAVKARFDLAQKARRIGGDDLDLSGSDNDIRVRALAKLGIKTDGRSEAYVEARLDAEIERLGDGPTVADVVGVTTTRDQQTISNDWLKPVWDARDRYLSRDDEEEVN